ncbi:EpsG family protein [Amylibacter sp.]|nr:EpsG family protein [Amylibacter sp.]
MSNNSNLNLFVFLISALCLAIFAGGRYEIGFDYQSYNEWYEHSTIHSFRVAQRDPLLTYVFSFFKYREISFSIALLILTSLSVLLKVKFIHKYSTHLRLSLIYYIGSYLLVDEMGQFRHALACGIGFWAVHFWTTKHKCTSFLLMISAIFFHSTLILLPIFLFIRKALTKVFLSQIGFIIALVGALIIGFIGVDFFVIKLIPQLLGGDRYANYLVRVIQRTESEGLVTIGFVWNFLYIILLYVANQKKDMRDHERYFSVLIFFGTMISISFGSFGEFGSRLSQFFLMFQIVNISVIFRAFLGSKFNYRTISIVFIMFAVGRFSLTIAKRGYDYLPYNNFLFGLL